MKWLIVIIALSASAVAQYSPLSPVKSPFLGVDMNSNSQWPDGSTNPRVRFNCVRIWDTPGASGWAQIETSAGTYVFTTLDTVLNTAQSNGVTCAMLPLNRTPTFYSSNTGDTICGYYVSIGSGTVNTLGTAVTRASGTTFLNTWQTIIINGVNYTIAAFIDGNHLTLGSSAGTQTGATFNTPSTNAVSGPGQCDVPTDINPDGSGTNLNHKNFVAALATHLKATFPSFHFIYESYNEPDTCKFFNSDTATQASCSGTGTINDLVRWEYDDYCIIKGTGTNNPFVGGQTCAADRALVTSVVLSGAIDPTATVVMGSYHGAPFSYNLAQNFLYCNHAPVPTNCTAGGLGATWTDAVNFHFKYGGKPAVYGDATTVMETVADTWITGVGAILQAAELAKPFYNTEGGYAAGGWVDCAVTSGAPPTCNYTDPDMEAAYIARNNVYQAWKGVSNAVFYDWSTSSGLHGLGGTLDVNHLADKAYDTSGQWLTNATGINCTSSAPGTVKAGLFTWTCTFVTSSGQVQAIVWDNSQSCSGGVCSTTNQTVSSVYSTYAAVDGSAPAAIVGHLVPIGIKPLLLNAISQNISGVVIKGLKASVGLGPPAYLGSTSGNSLYSVTTPFNGSSTFNSTTHSTLNPTSDCITLMTDKSLALLTTLDTSTMTFSGGDNDVMSSSLNTYFGWKGNQTHILKMDATGRCIQISGSEDSSLQFGYPFGFSRVRTSTGDSTLYHVQNFDIWTQEQIGVYPAFSTIATFDIRNCPGPMGQGIDPASGSILGIALNDAVFGGSVSFYGSQGTGRLAWAYKPGTGCATIDYGTGNWYAYAGANGGRQVNSATVAAGHATFTMAAVCPYTNGQIIDVDEPNLVSPATQNAYDGNWTVTTACGGGSTWVGTPNTIALPGGPSSAGWTAYVPSGTQTTCTSSGWAAGNGLHDSQTSLNGLVIVSSGACMDQIGSGAALWEIGTGNVAQGSGSLNKFTGHDSVGVTHAVQTNNPSPNIRTIYPLSQSAVNAYTTIGPLPGNLAETHGFWPHPTGDDSYPWLNCTATGTGYLTPTYLQNTCFGLTTDGSGVIKQFTPTFNSGTVSGAQFGMEFAIGFGFQDGTGMCWLSDLNLAMGLDSSGNQAGAILCAKLE